MAYGCVGCTGIGDSTSASLAKALKSYSARGGNLQADNAKLQARIAAGECNCPPGHPWYPQAASMCCPEYLKDWMQKNGLVQKAPSSVPTADQMATEMTSGSNKVYWIIGGLAVVGIGIVAYTALK